MALKNTDLYVQASRLPLTFRGSPQELFDEMIKRMKIVSPSGANFIFIGDTEPVSNVGPWLKGGTKWYVWDESTKRYVPVDVSDSVDIPFAIGASTPTTSTPPLWLKTSRDATEADPSYGDPLIWYFWSGSAWVPFNSVMLSGPTESRPTSPVEYQQYYDTTISCLIWWERAQWRTVSGVPGDVKAVFFETLTEALQFNPGWRLLGEANQHYRGRIIVQAAKDAGAAPETVLTVDSGIGVRAAFETFGETEKLQLNPASTVVYPGQLALWHLVKN